MPAVAVRFTVVEFAHIHCATRIDKGPYTNFFFYVDGFVGLAVADTLQTHLFVHEFLPAFTGFIYYGHVTDPVLPLDVNQYIRLLKNQRDVKWYTWSHRPNVQDA